MGILSDKEKYDIKIGDAFEMSDYLVWLVPPIRNFFKTPKLKASFEILLINAIKSCELSKWPGELESFVKSHLNAQKTCTIGTSRHLVDPRITQMDFYLGDQHIFSVMMHTKKPQTDGPGL